MCASQLSTATTDDADPSVPVPVPSASASGLETAVSKASFPNLLNVKDPEEKSSVSTVTVSLPTLLQEAAELLATSALPAPLPLVLAPVAPNSASPQTPPALSSLPASVMTTADLTDTQAVGPLPLTTSTGPSTPLPPPTKPLPATTSPASGNPPRVAVPRAGKKAASSETQPSTPPHQTSNTDQIVSTAITQSQISSSIFAATSAVTNATASASLGNNGTVITAQSVAMPLSWQTESNLAQPSSVAPNPQPSTAPSLLVAEATPHNRATAASLSASDGTTTSPVQVSVVPGQSNTVPPVSVVANLAAQISIAIPAAAQPAQVQNASSPSNDPSDVSSSSHTGSWLTSSLPSGSSNQSTAYQVSMDVAGSEVATPVASGFVSLSSSLLSLVPPATPGLNAAAAGRAPIPGETSGAAQPSQPAAGAVSNDAMSSTVSKNAQASNLRLPTQYSATIDLNAIDSTEIDSTNIDPTGIEPAQTVSAGIVPSAPKPAASQPLVATPLPAIDKTNPATEQKQPKQPTAVQPEVSHAIANPAVGSRSTFGSSDQQIATDSVANSLASFVPVTSPISVPLPAKSGSPSPANSSSPTIIGGPPLTAGHPLSSEPAAQTVMPIGASDDNSQPQLAIGISDPSLHKASVAGLGQVADTPASAQPVASAVADPTLQASIPATADPLATTGSAHKAESGSSSSSANQPANPSANLPASGELPPGPTTGSVQMAQMANTAAQSQMRIGLNTSAFGNVEVHTTVHANEVGLAIGSEKGDLRSLLSSELPGIANSLQQQNLRLNEVNFHAQGFAFSNQMSSGSDSQPHSFNARPMATTALPAEALSSEASEPVELSSSVRQTGLNILA